MSTRNFRLISAGIAASLCMAGTALAAIPLGDGTATGQWFDPNRSGEGFFVEIFDVEGGQQIGVAMYSFDENGNQLWFTGAAPINANDIGAAVPVIQVEGPQWGSAFDAGDGSETPFGTVTVQFPSCDTALFRVDSNVPELESYNYSLVRLTSISGMDCRDTPTQNPEDEGSVQSGLWLGTFGCFFVNEEGTAIVENDLCDDGKALSAEVPGVEIDLDGDFQEPDSCQANTICNGAWSIDFTEATPVVSCPGSNDAAAVVFFESATQARVESWEDITGDFLACYGTFQANAETE